MKRIFTSVVLIFFSILLLFNLSFSQNDKKQVEEISTENEKKIVQKNFYEMKMAVLSQMKLNSKEKDAIIDQETALIVLGVGCIVGFFASILIFNAEIFDTVPISLLGIGVALIMIGT